MNPGENAGWSVDDLKKFLDQAKRLSEIRTEIGRLPNSQFKDTLCEAVKATELALGRECGRGKPSQAPSEESVTVETASRTQGPSWLTAESREKFRRLHPSPD